MEHSSGVRVVEDIETLKALSDPVRLSILRAMMDGSAEPRSWTAKELAQSLGESQTKLYRHLRHLEEVGLIKVAETRLVSGIVEQRYAAAQHELKLSRDFIGGPETSDAERLDVAISSVGAAAESFLNRFEREVRKGRVELNPADEAHRPVVIIGDMRLPADRVADFHRRLRELVEEIDALPTDPEGVPMHLMIAMYETDG